MEEAEALKRLQRKDEQALCWFIDRYAAYVHTILRHILGHSMPELLEELCSDVFLAFWMNAGRVAPGKAKAYLGSIARNKAKEQLRKSGAEVPLEEDLLLIAPEDPAREVEEQELAAFLRQAVEAMDPSVREIFFRYYYYYQPVAVIAAEMQIPLATVKTKLHRGRKKLKTRLIEGGYCVENSDF